MADGLDTINECLTGIAVHTEPIQLDRIMIPGVRELYLNADEHLLDTGSAFTPQDIAKLILLDIKTALKELDIIIFNPEAVLASTVFTGEDELGKWSQDLLELQNYLLGAQRSLQDFLKSKDI